MSFKVIRQLRLSLILLAVTFAAVAQETEQPREGGLTGTGIVGLVNHEGVVEIGGLSVTLPASLSVRTPLGPTVIDKMRDGDMIAVELDGTLQNLSVVEAYQVIQIIGPIAGRTGKTLSVMGTTVMGADLASEARVGDWVAVSGYWREDGIVATRIAVVPPQDAVRVQGTYQSLSSGRGRVGDTMIKGEMPKSVTQGDVVRISGRLEDGAVVMRSSEVGTFAQDVRIFLAEGYQSTPDSSGFYTVLGTGISSVTDRPEMINWRDLVTVCSVDGELVAGRFFDPESTALCQQ